MPPGWYGWHSLRIRDPQRLRGRGRLRVRLPGPRPPRPRGEERPGRAAGRALVPERAADGGAASRAGHGLREQARAPARDADCAPPAYGVGVCFPGTYVGSQPSQDNLTGIVLGKGELPYLKDALPAVLERALPPQAARGATGSMPSTGSGARPGFPPSASACARRRLRSAPPARPGATRRARRDPRERPGPGPGRRGLRQDARGGGGRPEARAEGKKVLLLCFTAPLQKWLASRLEGSGVDAQTVSGLAKGSWTAPGRAHERDHRGEGAMGRAVPARRRPL